MSFYEIDEEAEVNFLSLDLSRAALLVAGSHMQAIGGLQIFMIYWVRDQAENKGVLGEPKALPMLGLFHFGHKNTACKIYTVGTGVE